MLTNLNKLGLQDGASQIFIVQDKWTTDPYKQQGESNAPVLNFSTPAPPCQILIFSRYDWGEFGSAMVD